ncbi:la-related protein 1C-like [Trifolium pratense]|uniref:la-related protein 1C-like n=1 Tax=Trifolium pratense TaxID=57577 RepID=UPI001E691EAF|nr:la-related protein 1C-like [Trifolium pratense]
MAMIGNHSSDNIQSRRVPVSSPWNQVVRGESESVVTVSSSVEIFPSETLPVDDSSSVSESFDNGGDRNDGTGPNGKRPVWNKPSANGVASEVRPVMDAQSWPALSESARGAVKSESSKGLLDGSSVPQSQGMESTPSSSSQKQVGGDNVHVNVNNVAPTRQKPIKHNSSNVSSSGGHTQQSAPQVSIAATGSHNSSSKDHTQRSGFVSNDHSHQRNSFRNRNGGPHQRGDGSNHHNYGNRRDQDWNNRRNFNGRDMHVPPRVSPRIIRPSMPPNSPQFIHPPPLRPYGGHMGFHELAPPVVFVAAPPPPPPLDPLRGVPFVPPMPHHALYYAGPDPQLHSKIVSQIDYYFSNENLVKDIFLRQNMDDQGWVPIKLIAGFKKVKDLTENIQLIIDVIQTSSAVEVQGDRIRRQNDWEKWILPPPVQFTNVQTHRVLNHDVLAEQVHNIALEKTIYDGAGGPVVVPNNAEHKPAFGDLNTPLHLSTSESTGQVGLHGSDHSISMRN